MRAGRRERGFTLIEVLIVTAIVAVVAGTLGTFFLAGASPALASAARDVAAALNEGRRAAIAFDAATVAFVPASGGSGYSARVYARFPGDAGFAPRNGPTYDSSVAISETASPLGAPGFAFEIDARGNVTGFANFVPGQNAFVARACPPSGAFSVRLASAGATRAIAIPCALPLSSATPAVFETPSVAWQATPAPSPTCPSTGGCTLALVTPPPGGAGCPAGYVADPVTAGLCDAPTPVPAPPAATCPPGSTGQPPQCTATGGTLSPTSTAPTPAPKCVAGAPDALGYATCLESNPIHITGSAITHQSCGTRTPITDPGPSVSVVVDVVRNGSLWGTYAVALAVLKTRWLDIADIPPAATCGLPYALAFSLATIAPLTGNAATTPAQDTGDPGLAQAGTGAILTAPLGGGWASST